MSMEVSSNYAGYYNNTLSDSKKESKQTAEVKSNTSATSKEKVQEYYEKLCKKFSTITFNTSGGLAVGGENKIVVNLSYDCLKRMANDPEFAKKMENDIAGIPTAHKEMFTKAKRDGIEIYDFAVRINPDGSMQCSGSARTRTSAGSGNNSTKKIQGKSESAEERIRKKRKEQETMEARRLEKHRLEKEFEERMAERHRERETYLDRTADGRVKLGQYQSSDVMQPISYFDANI